MMSVRKITHPEHDMQALQFKALEHDPRCEWMFAIPNAMKGNVIQQMWMKREGRKSGVSDMFLPVSAERWSVMTSNGILVKQYHGLFNENKFGDNKLSEDQAKFIIAMDRAGYGVSVSYSAQEWIDTVHRYLRGEHSNELALSLAMDRLR